MVQTYKDKYNAKFGFPKGTAHSLSDIAKATGFKQSGLETILDKGRGAFYSNPESVRPHVKDPTQWGMARVYSAVMGGAASKIDKRQLQKISR
jgi:hypothetical protein